MTLALPDLRYLAWHQFACDSCGEVAGRRCVTSSGARTTPHVARLTLARGWDERQSEVDELLAENDELATELATERTLTNNLTADLAEAATNAGLLTDQLKTARLGAALVPGLQQQVADLLAKIAANEQIISSLRARIDELEHPPADEVLISMDLSKVPLGPLTAAGAALIFGAPGKLASDNYWRFHTVVADPDGRRWLRWSTAKNTEGSAFGISLGIPLARRVDHCKMAYTLRFSPGFGWSYGGKLWGVSATTPGASPTAASGGKDPGPNGASSRLMWDTPGSYKSLAPLVNSLVAYWYANGKVEQNIFTRRAVAAGVPVDVVLDQAMNTPGKADGLLSLTQDGDELVHNETMPWRTDPTNQWSHLFPNEFRGGPNGDPRWAAPNDGWIDIADGLSVTTPAA